MYYEDRFIRRRNFAFGVIAASIVTLILVFIPFWQLILIPGVIAGLLNKKIRNGIYSGLLGISIVWVLYIAQSFITRNTYVLLDQFAGVIFGSLGYGWIFFLIIILMGMVFGALGGGIGSCIRILVEMQQERDLEAESSNPSPSTSVKSQET